MARKTKQGGSSGSRQTGQTKRKQEPASGGGDGDKGKGAKGSAAPKK